MNTIYLLAIIGFILMGTEILVGNFVLLLFGMTALALAGLQYFVGELPLMYNALLFGLIGGSGTYWLKKKHFFQKSGKSFSSENAFYLDKSLNAKAAEMVHYQGTLWTAVNDNDYSLAIGQKVKVTKTEGNRIFVDKV